MSLVLVLSPRMAFYSALTRLLDLSCRLLCKIKSLRVNLTFRVKNATPAKNRSKNATPRFLDKINATPKWQLHVDFHIN